MANNSCMDYDYIQHNYKYGKIIYYTDASHCSWTATTLSLIWSFSRWVHLNTEIWYNHLIELQALKQQTYWKVWITGLCWECEVSVETFLLKYITVSAQKGLSIHRPSQYSSNPNQSYVSHGQYCWVQWEWKWICYMFLSSPDTALAIFQVF